MAELFEVMMVICFGISWPISIYKSMTSKTNKGKSILFSFFIWVGYIFGTMSKFMSGNITYVAFFYILNFIMVSIDILFYFANHRLDKGKKST